MEHDIKMVDLELQNSIIRTELNEAISNVIDKAQFINGEEVKLFAKELGNFMHSKYVIPCGNGTDALMLALMALDLPKGSEVLVPTFNYVAAVEVIAVLGLKPVFVDIDSKTFTIDPLKIKEKVTKLSKAIIVVHIFGQCAEMNSILHIAELFGLKIIEDNAQSIGSKVLVDGEWRKAGNIGDIGTTSFFPTKNLSCMGDGGAVFTQDEALAKKIECLASHGQVEKYSFEYVGINSRLDTLQAAILRVKLLKLRGYNSQRQAVAEKYFSALNDIEEVKLPHTSNFSEHVFHQYTVRLSPEIRGSVKAHLAQKGVASMIYYPKPLHLQNAYAFLGNKIGDFPVSEKMSKEVLSLPIYPELSDSQIDYIASCFREAVFA